MFCFTVVDFGFAFKLHSSLKKETPLLQTPPHKTHNKTHIQYEEQRQKKENPNVVYFRLTCNDFFEFYFSAQPIKKSDQFSTNLSALLIYIRELRYSEVTASE